MKKNLKKIILICLVVAIFYIIGFFILPKCSPHQFIIPKGGTYYKGAYSTQSSSNIIALPRIKITYKEGDICPFEPKTGDAYVYGDYEYIYGREPDTFFVGEFDVLSNGWRVRVIDKNKTEYGEILEEINNKPVVSLKNAFEDCTYMIKSPTIPNGIFNVAGTFANCSSLVELPEIPDTVRIMYHTFSNCSSIITYVNSKDESGDFTNFLLPNGLKSINGLFYGCTQLKKAPIIPSGIEEMEYAFFNCISLTEVPKLPQKVYNMNYAFYGCASLTKVPEMPSYVQHMDNAFVNCTSLTEAPIIPHGVTSMKYTFAGCTSLTKAPEIPNTVYSLYGTFKDCTALIEAPTIHNKISGMRYTFDGCTSLIKAPVIPNSVEHMDGTFKNCISLTGEVTVHANPETYDNCFAGTNNITLIGSSNMLEELCQTIGTPVSETQ